MLLAARWQIKIEHTFNLSGLICLGPGASSTTQISNTGGSKIIMGKQDPITEGDYLEATEVTRMLGIRVQTLYNYVSRGWIHSVALPGRKTRLYLREDVERMRGRAEARSGHGAVAASAMNWGGPIISTNITELTPCGPSYRGRLAVDLARQGACYENVAELLWTGAWQETASTWPAKPLPTDVLKLIRSIKGLASNDQLFEVLALVVLKLGASQTSLADRMHGSQTLDAARQIIRALADCFACLVPKRADTSLRSGISIVEALIQNFGIENSDENRRALNAILILLADHELSPGTLVARVAAAGGATLHNCVAAAICATSGVKQGRLYDHIENLFARASTKEGLMREARQMQRNGSEVPGFGTHSVYKHGDPRADFLLDLASTRRRHSRRLETIHGFIGDARSKLGLYPRHELAVLVLAMEMGLPAHSAGSLAALARTAGWQAHVMEQRLSPLLLRPRAKFGALAPSGSLDVQ